MERSSQGSPPGLQRLLSRFPAPIPVGFRENLRAAFTAGLAIFLSAIFTAQFVHGVGLTTLLASSGACAVIVFAVPSSPMARLWPMLGGHFISATIGILCARYIPHVWTAAALAVGLSIFTMHLARCLHPPGGALTLIPILGGDAVQSLGFQFLLTPLALNLAIMALIAQIQNRLRTGTPFPTTPARDLPSLERIGIRGEDLRAALQELNAFVDVGEAELNDIYNRAAGHAYAREFGDITCERIMSRDLVTVEFGDELETVWQLMQRRKIKALPVIDRGRHVRGIITLTDFLRHARPERHDSLSMRLRALLRPTPTVTSDKPEVAGQIMSSPAISVRTDLHIAELAPLLAQHGIHQVPVVDARNKLVGLVTQSDLIAALYRNLSEQHSLSGREPP